MATLISMQCYVSVSIHILYHSYYSSENSGNSALLSRAQAFFLFFSFMCWDRYMWVVSCGLGSYSESFSRTLLFLFGTYSSLGTLQWNAGIIQLQYGLSLLPFKVLHVVGILFCNSVTCISCGRLHWLFILTMFC